MSTAAASIPRVGIMATLRNRRATVVSVTPFSDPEEGDLHLVHVEYTDSEGVPEDFVIWEIEEELGASLLEPTALPRVSEEGPMLNEDFDALVRSTRWSAISPFIEPGDRSKLADAPVASPFHGAIQAEDFQIVPLLKALKMPRISLLLADDVGLGKTIEAGLILQELILRRRIRRVLVICPASLRNQWQQEMHEKFSLSLDVVDRTETHSLRKRLGLDANPWRTFPKIVTSYHYLRQADVLEQFLSVCRIKDDSNPVQAQLPWDLLIVDEAHNLMPSGFGQESELTKMLRAITPYFEHKLFLTATPHNGHTRCFSGLLELLDPVRFTQVSEFNEQETRRIKDIMVRRLKREINANDDQLDRSRRFAERYLKPLPLYFSREEKSLSKAVEDFRSAVKKAISNSSKSEKLAGAFAVEVLSKRLLSCPYTFSDSWSRFKKGYSEDEVAELTDVNAAKRAQEADTDDDREREERTNHASRTVGAWLKPLAETISQEISRVDSSLEQLHLIAKNNQAPTPKNDSRLDRLYELIDSLLRRDRSWLENERLIVFTEYKTTLDYLEKNLLAKYSDDHERIRVLFGGMDQNERQDIKNAFNDPDDKVRVLIATDAASEGLNLQETARHLLHYDVPWNPARLEQRNGRLDRHGQARDVFIYHFTSEDDSDLDFLGKVIRKVDTIRDDLLGLVGEVFDAAFQRRFIDQDDSDYVIEGLDTEVERVRDRIALPDVSDNIGGTEETELMTRLCKDIDLSPESLKNTLESALSVQAGKPRIGDPDPKGMMRLISPIPTPWQNIINDTLSVKRNDGVTGALKGLVFDPELFIDSKEGRPVFRPRKDAALLHLGHPVIRQALATFALLRFPGHNNNQQISRWTVRRGHVPEGIEALLMLTVEELAVNNMREPFHHWVKTLRLPIKDGKLGEELPYSPPGEDRFKNDIPSNSDVQSAQEMWDDISYDLSILLRNYSKDLTEGVSNMLKDAGFRAMSNQNEIFSNRVREVERAMAENTLARLERERDNLIRDLSQGFLFEDMAREKREQLANLEDELSRRRNHYEKLLEYLNREKKRVLNEILPKRYSLKDTVMVFPVSVEVRLPMEVR